MARNIHADTIAKVQENDIIPYFMALVDTNAGEVLVWNGYGDYISSVSGSSKTYIGVGEMGMLSSIQESQNLAARGLTLTLSGIPSTRISQALTELEQGRLVRVFMGFFAPSTRVAINSEFEIFTGVTDIPTINEGGDTAIISITAENKLYDLERTRIRRYTQEDQARDDITDLGFEFVPKLQDLEILFGSSR